MCNCTGLYWIDCKLKDIRKKNIIKAIIRETKRLKSERLEMCILMLLKFTASIPNLLKFVVDSLDSSRFFTFSNLGVVLNQPTLLRNEEGKVLFGDTVIEKYFFHPSVNQHYEPCVFSALSYAGCLNIQLAYHSSSMDSNLAETYFQNFINYAITDLSLLQ